MEEPPIATRPKPPSLILLAVAAFVLGAVAWFLLCDSSSRLVTIGATADVTEKSSSLTLKARVDTGASVCSIHCEEMEIANESEDPIENIGSLVRFLLENKRGESKWIESEIADYSSIRTVDAVKPRYQVRLMLACQGVERKVLVSLRDRSHMKYRALLGRNFLRGKFTVDVDRENTDIH